MANLSTGAAAGLVALALTAGAARAAEWNVSAAIAERYNYDSNIRLSTGNRQEAWGFSTLPSFSITGRSPRLELSLGAGLEYTFYENAEDLNSFDQQGNASLGYSWERARVNLSGSVVHATTRTTELEDTGLNFTDAERLIFSGGGSWSYLVSQRDRLGVRGNASRSVADTSAIQDYTSYGGGAFWSRQLTEQDSIEVSGAYSRYLRTSGLDLESDSASGRLVYSREFTPQLKGSVHAGGRYVTTDETVFNGINFVSVDRSSTGVLAGVSLNYQIERGQFTGSYDRSVDASGVGRLQERDSFRLSAAYKTTPDVTLDLTGVFIMQRSVDDSADDGRKYLSAEPGASWKFFRNFYFRMSYRYRTQTFDNLDAWAVSHGAFASLSWRMPATPLAADN